LIFDNPIVSFALGISERENAMTQGEYDGWSRLTKETPPALVEVARELVAAAIAHRHVDVAELLRVSLRTVATYENAYRRLMDLASALEKPGTSKKPVATY